MIVDVVHSEFCIHVVVLYTKIDILYVFVCNFYALSMWSYSYPVSVHMSEHT